MNTGKKIRRDAVGLNLGLNVPFCMYFIVAIFLQSEKLYLHWFQYAVIWPRIQTQASCVPFIFPNPETWSILVIVLLIFAAMFFIIVL